MTRVFVIPPDRYRGASDSRVSFSGTLRAFQTGAIGERELLNDIDQQLTAGASPLELLEILERREYVTPLPDPVHDSLVRRLQDWPPPAETAAPDAAEERLDDTTPLAADPPPSNEWQRPAFAARYWPIRIVAIAGSLVLMLAFVTWRSHEPHRSLAIHAPSLPAAASGSSATHAVRSVSPSVPGTGSMIRDCPTCPRMRILPAGRFQQGSAADGPGSLLSETPQHLVAIGYSFAMAVNDVTVGDFRAFAAETHRNMRGCATYDGAWRYRPTANWRNPGFAQTDGHPVTCVSWDDAIAYARWMSLNTGHVYRLPSASEWEYAARAGRAAAASAAAPAICATANVADQSAARRYPGWDNFACDDGYVATAPVGSFIANAFGLNDVLGNVFQWTADCWHDDYLGAPSDGSARTDVDCSEHELRGGSWFSSPRFVHASYRNHFATAYRTSSVGFRLVREVR